MHTVCPKKRFCDEPLQNGDETKQYVTKHLQLRPRFASGLNLKGTCRKIEESCNLHDRRQSNGLAAQLALDELRFCRPTKNMNFFREHETCGVAL